MALFLQHCQRLLKFPSSEIRHALSTSRLELDRLDYDDGSMPR
jgi:hypothetical protein